MLILFSSRILFVVLTYQWCWQFIHSERLEVFLKDIIPWKTFPVFFWFWFWSWLKDRISLSERLVFFFILKDFQLIQKDLLFLILKDIFHQKDLDVKERHEFSSERHVFLFSERLVIFSRKTFNFLQKDLIFFQKDLIFFRKT